MEKYKGVKFVYKIKEGKIDRRMTQPLLGIVKVLLRYCKVKENEGNISKRVRKGMLIKRSRVSFKNLTSKDFSHVLKTGGRIIAIGGIPSSETFMHWEIYKKRSDVNVILHFHDDRLLNKSNFYSVGPYSYGTKKLAKALGRAMKKNTVLKIKKHGFVIVGKTPKEIKDYVAMIYRRYL